MCINNLRSTWNNFYLLYVPTPYTALTVVTLVACFWYYSIFCLKLFSWKAALHVWYPQHDNAEVPVWEIIRYCQQLFTMNTQMSELDLSSYSAIIGTTSFFRSSKPIPAIVSHQKCLLLSEGKDQGSFRALLKWICELSMASIIICHQQQHAVVMCSGGNFVDVGSHLSMRKDVKFLLKFRTLNCGSTT